jgi:hypothetical protein
LLKGWFLAEIDEKFLFYDDNKNRRKLNYSDHYLNLGRIRGGFMSIFMLIISMWAEPAPTKSVLFKTL